MGNYSNISIIIPSLNPTARLENVIIGIIKAGFDDIIIINDGSNPEHNSLFDRIGQIKQCTVLTHNTNMGKGVALRTAFDYFLNNRNGISGIITVDADGQHSPDDVAKCADALQIPGKIEDYIYEPGNFAVIGTRNFKQPDVPRRNALGNRAIALALRLLFGLKLRDTQTGLRGIPARFIPMLLTINGNRFEYETNMLLEFKRLGVPFFEVPIKTIYEQGSNERSNFRPLIDSVLIFSGILKYAMSSMTCFLADIGIFTIAMIFLRDYLGTWSILCCTVIARALSSFLNFNINRLLVFKQKNEYGNRVVRYYALVITIMLLSAGGLWLISLPFGGDRSAIFFTMLKIPLDLALFFLGFYIQRTWVFKKQ